MIKQLCDIHSIEKELKRFGYSDLDIPEWIKHLVPEATTALDKME